MEDVAGSGEDVILTQGPPWNSGATGGSGEGVFSTWTGEMVIALALVGESEAQAKYRLELTNGSTLLGVSTGTATLVRDVDLEGAKIVTVAGHTLVRELDGTHATRATQDETYLSLYGMAPRGSAVDIAADGPAGLIEGMHTCWTTFCRDWAVGMSLPAGDHTLRVRELDGEDPLIGIVAQVAPP